MDYSYNSDWNDYVKIECEKLKKKGHVFDAEGTHMKIIGEKYQKKLAREAKKKQKQPEPKAKKQQNNEDVDSCIHMMNIASNCCTLPGYVNEVARCEGIYQEWLITNPSKAKLLQEELIRHQREVSKRRAKSKYDNERKAQNAEAKAKAALEKVRAEAEAKAKLSREERKAANTKAKCEELSKVAYYAYVRQQEEFERVRKEAEAKQEQLAFEAKRRDEMLKIRAKQQEELVRVQNEAEAKRKQELEAAKALQELLKAREKEAKRAEEERRLHEIAAEKHREELEKANARTKELEEILKAKERDEITKSNARMKSLNEILKANARARELEAIVKANNEEIKAKLEKERAEFARFKAATMLNVEIANESSMAKCNIVSKLEIALKKEIERRKHDKNPVKFRLMRKSKTESKLALALKEVINRRMKIKLGLL